MKKTSVLLSAFIFVLIIVNVSAMDDPIRFKAQPGEEIRFFIWPAEYGPAINLDRGFADEKGYFNSKTLFSLKENNFTLQVYVFNEDGDERSYGRFEEMNSLSPIFVDCFSSNCVLSFWEVENESSPKGNLSDVVVAEEVVENETIEDNQTVIVGNRAISDVRTWFVGFTGNAIFRNKDGSFNFTYPIGAGIILILIFVSIFLMMHHGHGSGKEKLSDEDKELSEAEKKLKATEDKIKSIRDAEAKKKRLAEIKAKLAADERELQELEGAKKSIGDNIQKKPGDDNRGAVAGEWD